MRKALDIITIVTGILMLGILGGGFFTYKYVTSPEFERNVKNKIMNDLQEKMKQQIPKQLPKFSGPSLPL